MTVSKAASANRELWAEVDRYVESTLVQAAPVLDAVLAENAAAGLPAHDVSPSQGKLLFLLARLMQAKRILEIGTLGAYSTIWLAQALPTDGRIITLEIDPNYAGVARANLTRAGIAEKAEVRVGPAIESMEKLLTEQTDPFDLIFIDADKPNNPSYLKLALDLSRPGTAILADNVIRAGTLIDHNNNDPRVQGVRNLHQMMATDPRIAATTIQTVGAKGYDGFTLAIVG